MTNCKNQYYPGITPGSKCSSCYTTTYVYYSLTDKDGNKFESCECCLDKVRELAHGKDN